jgi:acetolactate synthase-1/2/3 large subunit
MADALADGVPMVVFTGQVATSAIGSDAFQEVDSIGLSRACTKWNVMVKNVAEVSTRISDAFEIAMSGRPGPVLVDLPKDVTAGILRRAIATKSALLPRVASTLNERSQDSSIRAIAHLINIAKKPVIYAGHGVVCSRGGPELLRALADKSSIPVATSLQGLGAFDELDEKSLRMLDTRESAPANMAMQEADLIIVLGSRFDDRIAGNVARFALGADIAARKRGARIVQFDIMPKNINKVVQVSEAVEGDVAANLRVLLPQVEPRSMADRRVWFDQINAWKTGWPLLDQSREKRLGILEPQTVVEELSKMLDKADGKRNTIVTTGVGQHQMWAAQHFRWRHSRSMITSGGLGRNPPFILSFLSYLRALLTTSLTIDSYIGTMGYGLPAAIGAKVARPDALVIDIDGDASFAMTLTELATAAQFNVGVKVLLFNNEEQGMATRWQGRFYEGRYARKHQLNTDFLKLAGAMGLRHVRRVVEPADVVDSLEWLVNTQGPALLEVVVDKKMPASPTVPAREGVHEIFV